MNTLTFLLSTVIELYTMALLLRVWMQWSRRPERRTSGIGDQESGRA